MESKDRWPCSQAVLQGPRDCQAHQDPQAQQVPKASKGHPGSQEQMDPQGSRGCPETPAVRGTQDPQGSWVPEAPKVPQACLDQMDSRVPSACQGQQGPLGTGAFLEKSWGPSRDHEEMLDCPDTPD